MSPKGRGAPSKKGRGPTRPTDMGRLLQDFNQTAEMWHRAYDEQVAFILQLQAEVRQARNLTVQLLNLLGGEAIIDGDTEVVGVLGIDVKVDDETGDIRLRFIMEEDEDGDTE